MSFKQLLPALAAFAALATLEATPAVAADLPVKAPPLAPAAVITADWTGFYVDGDIG
jgi:hypothetical protein